MRRRRDGIRDNAGSELASLVAELVSSKSSDALQRLGEYMAQLCKEVGGESAGLSLLEVFVQQAKYETDVSHAMDARREALINSLVEVVMQCAPDMRHSERVALQIEELVKLCTQHFRRTVIKMSRDEAFDRRHLDSAHRLYKILGKMRKMQWPSLEQSVAIRRARELVGDVGRKHAKIEEKRRRQTGQTGSAMARALEDKDDDYGRHMPAQRRSNHSYSNGNGEERQIQRVEQPQESVIRGLNHVGRLNQEVLAPIQAKSTRNGVGSSVVLSKSTDAPDFSPIGPATIQSHPPPTPSHQGAAVRLSQYAKSGPPDSKQTQLSYQQAGKAVRYDLCKFVRETCDALRFSRETTSAAFYFLHVFILHVILEPKDQAPSSARSALAAVQPLLDRLSAAHAANQARGGTDETERIEARLRELRRGPRTLTSRDYQLVALSGPTLREASDEYLRALPSDEAASIGLAAIHLAAKARDAPQRLASIVETSRASVAKRGWPLALPWRDQILLVEHRILRCLCFDLRVDDIEPTFREVCPNKRRYTNDNGEVSSLAIAPPVTMNSLSVDPDDASAAVALLSQFAFQATGLCAEQEPKILCCAAVLFVTKQQKRTEKGIDSSWLRVAVEECYGEVLAHSGAPLSATAHKRGVAQLRGLAIEIEQALKETTARFHHVATEARLAELNPQDIVEARAGAAKRAAEASLARLGTDSEELARYLSRRMNDSVWLQPSKLTSTSHSPSRQKKATLMAPAPNGVEAQKQHQEQRHSDAKSKETLAEVKALFSKPATTRRRRDDETAVIVYFSDDPAVSRLAASTSKPLTLLTFPSRQCDADFRRKFPRAADEIAVSWNFEPGDRKICAAAEPDAHEEASVPSFGSMTRHFYPVLHVVWPRSDVEKELKLDETLLDASRRRTAAFVDALREAQSGRKQDDFKPKFGSNIAAIDSPRQPLPRVAAAEAAQPVAHDVAATQRPHQGTPGRTSTKPQRQDGKSRASNQPLTRRSPMRRGPPSERQASSSTFVVPLATGLQHHRSPGSPPLRSGAPTTDLGYKKRSRMSLSMSPPRRPKSVPHSRGEKTRDHQEQHSSGMTFILPIKDGNIRRHRQRSHIEDTGHRSRRSQDSPKRSTYSDLTYRRSRRRSRSPHRRVERRRDWHERIDLHSSRSSSRSYSPQRRSLKKQRYERQK